MVKGMNASDAYGSRMGEQGGTLLGACAHGGTSKNDPMARDEYGSTPRSTSSLDATCT
jgi:hypothetical protein